MPARTSDRWAGEAATEATASASDAPGPRGSSPTTRPSLSRARWRSLARTPAAYALTLFLLVTINFLLPRAMPGNPVDALVDPSAGSFVQDEALRAEIAAYYGLDRPLTLQYLDYLAALARGDLGTSIRYNRPVADLLAERLPWTLLLVGTALTAAAAGGILGGVHSGWRRGRPVDRRLLVVFLALRNLPVFFLGSVALYLFAVRLGWVPLAGAVTPFSGGDQGLLARLLDIAHHLVLPAAVMATGVAADYFLVMRAGMVGELGADYLVAGRARGLRERRLKYRYAARNALVPTLSLIAARAGTAISGLTIFVETVFAYPGVGRLVFDSVSFRDYPTLQGCFLVLAVLTLSANFAADLAAVRLDPRVAA